MKSIIHANNATPREQFILIVNSKMLLFFSRQNTTKRSFKNFETCFSGFIYHERRQNGVKDLSSSWNLLFRVFLNFLSVILEQKENFELIIKAEIPSTLGLLMRR